MSSLIPIGHTGRRKAPRPVESFGPEIMAALMRGATEPLVMKMPYKMGVRFRLRVHQLREAMRDTGHSKYELVARVRVTIEWPEATPCLKQGRHKVPIDRDVICLVTLRPNDTEFADLLFAAGVDPLSGVISGDSSSTSILDEILKDL